MNNKIINIILLTGAIAIIAIAMFFKKDKPLKELPYYGKKISDTINEKKTESYHKVGNFSFISQTGETITQKNLEGKIYVTDYFFTTCKSICPIMTNQMQRIYNEFKNEDKVCFVSHTVDPEVDSVNVLAEYAKSKNADSKKWFFLTGNKKDLYEMARNSYYLDAEQGDGGPDDFIHTPNFALIDANKHIRGYYDGTDSVQVNMLINDIKILLMSSN